MKKYITLFILCFCLSQAVAQDYVDLNLPVEFGGRFIEKIDGRFYSAGWWNGGLHYSDDDGQNWETFNWPTTTEAAVSMLLVDDTLFALTAEDLLKSNDNGETWEDITNLVPEMVNGVGDQIIMINNKLFILVFGYGVYTSIDNGNTWELNVNFPNNDLVNNYGIVETSFGIYTYGYFGVSRSIDNGETWEMVFYDPNHDFLFNSMAEYDGVLYANTNEQGVVKSLDEGVTWEVLFPCLNGKKSFILDGDFRIYVGCKAELAYSDDFGDSWTSIYNPVLDQYIFGLNIIEDKLYVNSFGGGLFRVDNFNPYGILGVNDIKENKSVVFPVPATNEITITIENQNATKVNYSITNSLGQHIKVNTPLPTSNKIDISDLASGIYMLTLLNTDNGVLETHKLVKE